MGYYPQYSTQIRWIDPIRATEKLAERVAKESEAVELFRIACSEQYTAANIPAAFQIHRERGLWIVFLKGRRPLSSSSFSSHSTPKSGLRTIDKQPERVAKEAEESQLFRITCSEQYTAVNIPAAFQIRRENNLQIILGKGRTREGHPSPQFGPNTIQIS